MKAITLWQPFASLIVSGAKKYETRSWPTKYRGQILIHSSKKAFYDCWFNYISSETRIEICQAMNFMDGSFNYEKYFPTGYILGSVTISDCIRMTDDFIEQQKRSEILFGDWRRGRYAWELSDPVIFENPIPTSGFQGLWNYDLYPSSSELVRVHPN